ncbi:unnamed protein product, partial [marine sediment metagenome]
IYLMAELVLWGIAFGGNKPTQGYHSLMGFL